MDIVQWEAREVKRDIFCSKEWYTERDNDKRGTDEGGSYGEKLKGERYKEGT